MMINEFEKLTGIEVTPEEYSTIEYMYYEFDGDKREFCKWFKKENKMIDVLRQLVDEKEKVMKKTALDLSCAQASVRALKEALEKEKAALEKEQEWQPYEMESNVKQADYDKLNNCSSRKELTDDEAIDLIAYEFGFDRSKIRIIHSVKQYEKNRHGYLRAIGEVERKPLYDATDWNYIRFDVSSWYYEMRNGNLRQFYA